jgi:fatty acid desaturase
MLFGMPEESIAPEGPPTKAAKRGMLRTLRNARDWQSLAYLVALPLLAIWQWRHGFSLPLYALMLLLAISIGVIHHNHAHLPMWRGRMLNRATDLWITLLQGHPTFVFFPAHVANHHRHRHGELDVTRTYRFSSDTNDLRGWLLHPLQAIGAVYPLLLDWLARLRARSPGAFRWCMIQYAVWLGSWFILLALDPFKTIAFVIVPQLFGLHWLLGANYLQHAHADGRSDIDYARNFEGLVNPLLFNIGLHTAHHEHPRAHWSELPRLHRECKPRIDARLIETGFFVYAWRVFVLGTFLARYRSTSLMSADAAHDAPSMPVSASAPFSSSDPLR